MFPSCGVEIAKADKVKEILNEIKKHPITNSGCIVASDHRAVKRGSTSGAASLFIYGAWGGRR
jgi:hypothetical protein